MITSESKDDKIQIHSDDHINHAYYFFNRHISAYNVSTAIKATENTKLDLAEFV